MNFYCIVDVSTDKTKPSFSRPINLKNNYKNTFNLNVTKKYVYHFNLKVIKCDPILYMYVQNDGFASRNVDNTIKNHQN